MAPRITRFTASANEWTDDRPETKNATLGHRHLLLLRYAAQTRLFFCFISFSLSTPRLPIQLGSALYYAMNYHRAARDYEPNQLLFHQLPQRINSGALIISNPHMREKEREKKGK